MKKWWVIRNIVSLAYSLAVTYMSGVWAVRYALTERGYSAVGGEHLFIPMMAWLAYKMINKFFKVLEEEYHAECRKSQKRGSGSVARIQDYRQPF